MPLHLLGKKSWNVYNTANIERVKADEAKAAAREEAEEQRMQEADAERRLQILRGEWIEPPATGDARAEEEEKEEGFKRRDHHGDGLGRERKRRRIAGEDETDREMRYIREDRAVLDGKAEMQMTSKKSSDAPLVDTKGHINLFPVENRSHKETKNAEAEAEKAKKKREYEDQFTMRFSNAAGFKQAVGQKAWYENTGIGDSLKQGSEMPSQDVWGQEDPRKKEREKKTVAADDPLAMMRNGAAGVREAERQRTKWREEKAREIREIEDDERRRKKRRRHHEVDKLRQRSPTNSHRSREHHDRYGDDTDRRPYHSHHHHHHTHSHDRDRHQPRRQVS